VKPVRWLSVAPRAVAARQTASLSASFAVEKASMNQPGSGRRSPGSRGEPASIDFNIDLPPLDMPAAEAPVEAPAVSVADAGLDFKIDVGDLNINLDDTSTQATPASAGKDGHWYDVQQKFDLAKAYQEMGDNDGAREILHEVIKEGDAEQQDQAQKLLSSLG
jgi:pilus assembly protein FimV